MKELRKITEDNSPDGHLYVMTEGVKIGSGLDKASVDPRLPSSRVFQRGPMDIENTTMFSWILFF